MKLKFPKRFSEFSPRFLLKLSLLSIAALACGLFVMLTLELRDDNDVHQFDTAVLQAVAAARVSIANGPAVDITAMGSGTFAFLACITGMVFLALAKDFRGALFFLISVSGAGLWSGLLKTLVRRERPSVVEKLVEVSNFSYPSGHTLTSTAMFFTLALIVSRHYKSWRTRALLFTMAGGFACLVGFSRIYLGVHYPSDVLSGMLFGCAWVAGLGAIYFSLPDPTDAINKA